MKIVKLKGGLGNQMFQYAFAKLLEQETGDIVKIDTSYYAGTGNDTIRKARIYEFALSLPTATQDDLKQVCTLQHTGNPLTKRYKLGLIIEALINRKYFFERNRSYISPDTLLSYTFFDGYWQSYKYVDQIAAELKKEFTPAQPLSENTMSQMRVMEQQNAVFMGVRKGDYGATKQTRAHYGSFPSEYYRKAMDYIAQRVEKPVFYLFSNDIPWCKENLDLSGYHVEYRDPEKQTSDFEELMLMKSCKHAIIVNSTYHWWGAQLMENAEKIVCCPERWFFDDAPIDILPPEWVRISC